MLYLDYAATTPMGEQALKVYQEVAQKYYGNPSSLHDIGSTAKQLLDKCREELGRYLNADSKGIFFTSGGSESNVLSIRSLLNGNKQKGRHLITTELEHSSVLNLFKVLEHEGFEVTYLPVNENGQISLEELKSAIRSDTILASIHHANSEIGTIQEIKEIGKLLKMQNILFHCDCVQTFGKEIIDVKEYNIDSLSISSHKIYGPKGVGACYINQECFWKPVIPNTTHESGFRPGTVNVPGIAAFITAAEDMINTMEQEKDRMMKLRTFFINGLKENKEWNLQIEGDSNKSLPHIIGLRVRGLEGQYTMLECNRYGIAISTGSACQVGQQAPSKTMVAIGRNEQEAKEFVRLSFGRPTKEEDIIYLLKSFAKFLPHMKD